MPRIRVLSEELANRIAAGEVVERPASVVKELVENALDAGARRVEVDLVDGGKRLIRVRDDGMGMSPEDAVLAVQRFATSKIRDPEDLDNITTLGFRGEALPSIAAVSHLSIQTREPDRAEGCQVRISGGGPPEVRPIGCPPGTCVEVRDLFFNTPARLKFLASSARERGHAADWVTRLALARPDVAFKLTHDGEVIFASSGSGDVRSVLAAIYGSPAAREFLPVEAEGGGLQLTGFISGPRLLRATREHQLFFVNHRFVRSRQMGHALNEAYGLLLPAGRHPLCALYLAVSPELVDPNVHPTKIEVRFRNPGLVYELVQRGAEEALARSGFRSLTQAGRHIPRSEDPLSSPGLSRANARFPAGRFSPPAADLRERASRLRVNPFEDRVDVRDDGLEVYGQGPLSRPRRLGAPEGELPLDIGAGTVEVLGHVGHRYLVARTANALLLIDQHRATERVIMERLSTSISARQLLITPEALQLSPGEAAAVRDHGTLLADLGYDLEDFGPDTFLVRSVPAVIAELQPVDTLRDLIAELAELGLPTAAERRDQELRARLACHAATKAGERLTLADMQRLVDDLLASDSPAVCPHGDPIIVTLDLARLDREFRR